MASSGALLTLRMDPYHAMRWLIAPLRSRKVVCTMSGMTFTASMQIAIDWVSRHLLYPEDRVMRPIPKHVGFVWFTRIQPDRTWVNRADDLSPSFQSMHREINFFVGDQKVIILTLEGLRHFYPVSGRPTRTEWMPTKVWYRTNWATLEVRSDEVHEEEIFCPDWVNISSTYAPEV